MAKLFWQSAERFGQRPALRVAGQSYSYDELFGHARSIAWAIVQWDPEPEYPLAGLFAYRSLTAYAGVLGALLSGRGYVPLNPTFPSDRNARMLQSSRVGCVILDEGCVAAARPVLSQCERPLVVLHLPTLQAQDLARDFPQHRFVAVDAAPPAGLPAQLRQVRRDDIAYLLFTSGSTGIPKGVMVSHGNVRRYVDSVYDRYQPTPEDRFSQAFDMTFDLSAHDMFLCWKSGACLCCIPEQSVMAPAKFIRHEQLTFWFSVPSTVGFMMKLGMLKPGSLPSLRMSLFCGEALPVQSANAWQEAACNSVVENLYGPTETTIAITAYRWGRGAESPTGTVPIGSPLPDQKTIVVSEELKPLPSGESGELCLGGTQLALGYWLDPAKTADRFVTLPSGPTDERWYRTGDLVKDTAEHGLLYLGRLDSQIKILGHRVELGEIEHVIRTGARSDLVAALGWPVSDSGASGVIAYVSGSAATVEEILEACRGALPPYMVPKEIHFLEEMPLNVNGKIDRGRLRRMREESDAGTK